MDDVDNEWKAQVWEALRRVIATRTTFTTETVWRELRTFSTATTPEPRAMGTIMHQAKKEGLCEPTDEYRSGTSIISHRRPMRVWRTLGRVRSV